MEYAGPERDIIVVGASAGGVETLIELCSRLPGNLNASVFIVLHTAPTSPGLLPTILQRYTDMTVLFPESGSAIERGMIYVAPPNRHLLVQSGKVLLSSGPRENLLRPAADALFRSAAGAYGPRVVGVILSGTRSDGTIGLQLVKQAGGMAIVQDPKEAVFSSMPDSALHNLDVDYVVKVADIAGKLVQLSGTIDDQQGLEREARLRAWQEAMSLRNSLKNLQGHSDSSPFKQPGKLQESNMGTADTGSDSNPLYDGKGEHPEQDTRPASYSHLSEGEPERPDEISMSDQKKPEQSMTPDPFVRRNAEQYENGALVNGNTPLTCPECGGALWERKEGKLSQYVCHVGHRFSESSLLTGMSQMLEEALWTAVRALEERAFFWRRLANRSEAGGRNLAARKFHDQADEASTKASFIRDIITSGIFTASGDGSEEEEA